MTQNNYLLFRFAPPVTYNNQIIPLCLPDAQHIIPIGTICYATGTQNFQLVTLVDLYVFEINQAENYNL